MKVWIEADVNFLVTNKGKLSHSEMAVALGRSIQGVNRKVAKLGISKKRTGGRLTDGVKKCSRCEQLKPAESFAGNKTRYDGKEAWCKRCRIENMHNMEVGEYDRQYQLQKGLCSICKRHFAQLVVDHCHDTDKNRELLCDNCNWLLGNACDNPGILASAILYLKRHGKKIGITNKDGSITGDYLISRQRCCGNGCRNCPW